MGPKGQGEPADMPTGIAKWRPAGEPSNWSVSAAKQTTVKVTAGIAKGGRHTAVDLRAVTALVAAFNEYGPFTV